MDDSNCAKVVLLDDFAFDDLLVPELIFEGTIGGVLIGSLVGEAVTVEGTL
jgi:hypothetical protein